MVPRGHCASAAVFAPKAHWAKLSGRSQVPQSKKADAMFYPPGKDVKKCVSNGKGVPGMSSKSLKESDENKCRSKWKGMRQPERMEGLPFLTEMVQGGTGGTRWLSPQP